MLLSPSFTTVNPSTMLDEVPHALDAGYFARQIFVVFKFLVNLLA